jgi:hypothetical protein
MTDESCAFISYNHQPVKLGKLLTKFFKRTLRLHITTNTIRSLVETSSGQLHMQGDINGVDRAAIMNINGHSSACTEKFYIKRSLSKDVSNARGVFQKLLPGIDVDNEVAIISDDDEEFGANVRQSLANAAATATATTIVEETSCVHPDASSPNKRIPWTDYEVNFVGRWCKRNSCCPNVVAQCLKHIKSDPNIKKNFHPIHIADSSRLRHGLQAYNKKRDENGL